MDALLSVLNSVPAEHQLSVCNYVLMQAFNP